MTMLLDATGLAIDGRLQPTDLALAAGSLVALVGPNGGGKTSLLRAIAGNEEAEGYAKIDGSPLTSAGPRRARMIGLMSASRDIGWAIPVRDVIEMGVFKPEEARIRALITEFELGSFLSRPVNTLSTGERARVLMARVLSAAPRLLLLDEPLSNLEPYWVIRFLEAMRRHAESGAAVLCALHDLAQLDRFDRAVLVAKGRIEADMRPAELIRNSLFEKIFRIAANGHGGWTIRPPEDPRSSP